MHPRIQPYHLFIILILAGLSAHAQDSRARDSQAKPISSDVFVSGVTIIEKVDFTDFGASDPTDEEDRYDPTSAKNLLQHLQYEKLKFEVGESLDKAKVEKAITALKEHLSNYGFFKAEIVAQGEILDGDRMKLILSLKRGPRSTILSFKFNGTRVFSNDELSAVIKECLGEKATWNFDKRHVEYCANKNVREFLFSKGYFEAKILGPKLDHLKTGVNVSFDVSEGVRYRWGKFEIKGNKVFSEKEILEAFGQRTGDIADGKSIQDFVYRKLQQLYFEKGYIQYNAEFDPEFVLPGAEGLDATSNFVISIDEGKPFKIKRIELVGVDDKQTQKLLEILSIKPGELYVPSKLEAGIKKINETEKFEFLDIDQDIEILISEDFGDVVIQIKLKPAKP